MLKGPSLWSKFSIHIVWNTEKEIGYFPRHFIAVFHHSAGETAVRRTVCFLSTQNIAVLYVLFTTRLHLEQKLVNDKINNLPLLPQHQNIHTPITNT